MTLVSARAVLLATVISCAAGVEPVEAQQTVRIAVPTAVTFTVTNLSATTVGTPAPTMTSVTEPSGFSPSNKLRISIRAEGANFTGPDGAASFAASGVTWTATAAQGNTSSGTLSATTFSEIYRSSGNFSSAALSVTWRLAPPSAAGIRAGIHTLGIRWKVEVF